MLGIWIIFIVCSARLLTHYVGAEVFHPPIENVALKKPLTLQPSDSTCGLDQEQEFCKSTEEQISVETCWKDACSSECPSHTRLKPHVELFAKSTHVGDCLQTSNIVSPNGTASYSIRFNATGNAPCYVDVDFAALIPIRLQQDSWSITFSVWIYAKLGTSTGTLLDIAGAQSLIRVMVVNGVVALHSGGVTSSKPTWSVPDEEWHHLALQIHKATISVFVDGRLHNLSIHDAILVAPGTARKYRVGQSLDGSDSFNGFMQDARIYLSSASNREVIEILTGQLPETRIQTSCRCPEDFPSLTGDDETYCSQNPPLSQSSAKYRLDDNSITVEFTNSHPPEYANDGKTSTFWVSAIDKGDVSLQVDLQDQYEVRKVQLVFYSPYPSVIRIERRVNSTSDWQGWQYYSQNCQLQTGYPTNGKLTAPGDTNCKFVIEPNEDPKYTGGVITFDLLEDRPGQGVNGSFSVDLRHFLLASGVRIRLEGHPYLPNNAEKRHTYHGIIELRVEAMCNCYGHGVACDMASPYTCTCAPSSNTAGRQCNACATGTYRMNGRSDYAEDLCQQCACHTAGTVGASDTCDPLGGQCVCKSHTSGRRCDRCLTDYHNMTSSNPGGCQHCVCDVIGTVNASTTCNAMTGQCPCMDNVDGVHCDRCKHGYFNLTGDNPSGCTNCSCNAAGTLTTDQSCDLVTGQCHCKKHVTGLKCNECVDGFTHLTSLEPDGCVSCGCDTNGSLSESCDVTTGQCDCRSNVTGLKCDRCVDGRYALDATAMLQGGCQSLCNCSTTGTDPARLNACEKFGGRCRCKVRVEGHDCDICEPRSYDFGRSDDEGCVACACDERGTIGGSVTCDATTGQCVCKRNVQSRTCAVCMAGSFGLTADNVDGCQPCECYERGVTLNSTCDSVDGQCQCEVGSGDAAKGGRKCMAYLETVSPSYGPRSGGTSVTVSGGFLRDADNTTVWLEDSPCLVDTERSSATRVVCMNEPLTGDTLGQALVTTVTLSDGASFTLNASFVYMEDPLISKVEPVSCIVGGGITLTVSGSHLDSIAWPLMSVSVYHDSVFDQQVLSDCSITSGDTMLCESPKFNISTPASRRRRDTDGDAIYLADRNSQFYIGFLLDGVMAYRNMSQVAPLYSLLRVYSNPEFTMFTGVRTYRPYWPYNDDNIVVKGKHLTSGATVDDYSIMIGQELCASLDLTANQIACFPPESQPEPDISGVVDGAPAITVRVGNIVAVVGYIRYEETFWDNEQLRYGIIGGVLGLILIITLVVVFVVIWRRRRHRTNDDPHPNLEMKDKSKTNSYISAYNSGGYVTPCSTGLLEILSPELKERISDVLILDPKRMVVGKLLVEGQYGRVHIGRLADEFHSHHMPITIKTLRDRDITPCDISDFLEEAVMMKDFKHENILGLIGVAIERNHSYVLLPCMDNGDIKTFISNEENMLTVGELIDYGLQVSKGMCYLSDHHFVHRDLACRNCMVSKDLVVKIADCGLSRDIHEHDYYQAGDMKRPLPVKWMALESLELGKFTSQTDVWAFGILMWELQTRGCTPYPDVEAFDMKTYLLCGNRMDRPDYAPEEIYALMLRCWCEDPDDRPTFREIFEELETFLNLQNTKTLLRSRQRLHVPSSVRDRNNFPGNGFA